MFEFNATFLIAMISFVVFIMIMNSIFYQPILEVIRKRENYINNNYDESKEFQKKADEYNTTRNTELNKKQDECRVKIRSSLVVAHEKANKELEVARDNTKKALLAQKEELNNRRNTVKEVIKQRVIGDLASSIVSKILNTKSKVEDFDTSKIDRIIG